MEAEGPRHQALPHYQRLSDDQKLLAVLNLIKEIGFASLFEFLQCFLMTKDKALIAQAALFAHDSALPLLKILIPRSGYGPLQQNAKRKKDKTEEIGSILVPWVSGLFAQEMSKLANDPRARLAPSQLRQEHVNQFSFRTFEDLFEERAPLLFNLLSTLCKVRDGDHAGTKLYKANSKSGSDWQHVQKALASDSDSDNGFSLPPAASTRGWNDYDVESDYLESDDSEWEDELSEQSGVIGGRNGNWLGHWQRGISGADSESVNVSTSNRGGIAHDGGLGSDTQNARTKQPPGPSQKRSLTSDSISCDPFGNPMVAIKKARVCRPRRMRNKAIIVTTVLAQMLFAHSRTANAFQTMMAAFNFASKTGKRANAVLNQLGLTVSPVTFGNALKKNASATVHSIKKKFEEGKTPALFYDNLVIYDQKGEETEINKNRSLQLTVCAGYFLRLPPESPQELNSTVDSGLGIRAVPAIEQRGILMVKDSSALLLLDQNGEYESGSKSALPRISDYRDLSDSEDENGVVHPCPGIPTEDLFYPNPDYLSLRPLDIINPDSIIEFYNETVKGHLCALLCKHFPDTMRRSAQKPYKLKTYFQVPIEKSEVFTLPTLDIDESTIDGNAEILERLMRTLDINLEHLEGMTIPVSGDQMTLSRIRAVQQLRIRDIPKHRAGFANPWMGFLHYGFAAVDVVKRCSNGAHGGGDPGSVGTFVRLLGRTGILDSKPNYNATHRLCDEMSEAYSLAAFLAITNTKGLKELEEKLREDWRPIVDKVFAEYYPLPKVGMMRARALQKATEEYEQEENAIRTISKANRTTQQQEFLAYKDKKIAAAADRERDLSYENALLFMQHSMVYRDFYNALRSGDSGRLEKSLEIFTVLFEGVGKSHYARELMEQQVDRKAVWTPYMHALWRQNCLLNLSGSPQKFLGVDEVCEFLVRQLKSTYNPKNTWQSKEFHMETLSRLTMVFRDVRRTVASSSGAPSYGSRHSRLEKSHDINLMLTHICDNKLLLFREGRNQISSMRNARRTVEGIDAWTIGQLAHGTGGPLATLLRKRIETRIASRLYPTPPPVDGFCQDDFYEDAEASGSDLGSWSEDDSFEFDSGSSGGEEVFEIEM